VKTCCFRSEGAVSHAAVRAARKLCEISKVYLDCNDSAFRLRDLVSQSWLYLNSDHMDVQLCWPRLNIRHRLISLPFYSPGLLTLQVSIAMRYHQRTVTILARQGRSREDGQRPGDHENDDPIDDTSTSNNGWASATRTIKRQGSNTSGGSLSIKCSSDFLRRLSRHEQNA
jgi:hypothetical protein